MKQLPLSQCRFRMADPLSEGPAALMPITVCAGLTHGEARREAGLAGIEAYVSRIAGSRTMMAQPVRMMGVGAGGTVREAMNRALQKGLSRHAQAEPANRTVSVRQRKIGEIRDPHCRFYVKTLTVMRGMPVIGEEEELCLGFPVMWVRAGGVWHGSAGLNRTLALRMALQRAILHASSPQTAAAAPSEAKVRLEVAEEQAPPLDIPETEELDSGRLLESALRLFKDGHCRLSVFDLAVEPFLQAEFGAVLGVRLEKEEGR